MTEADGSPKGLGLFARLTGVLFNPRPTYEAIVARPTWFGAAMAAAIVAAICTGGFLMTDVGQQAWLDQMDSAMSGAPAEQRAQQMAMYGRLAPYVGYIGAAQMLIFFPIVNLVFAGLAYFIFNVMMGGDGTYKKVLAVVSAGSAVSIVQQLFTTPLNYVRGSITSPTNLSVFVPMLPEGSFVTRLTGDDRPVHDLVVRPAGDRAERAVPPQDELGRDDRVPRLRRRDPHHCGHHVDAQLTACAGHRIRVTR